jgi:hypothetical protein
MKFVTAGFEYTNSFSTPSITSGSLSLYDLIAREESFFDAKTVLSGIQEKRNSRVKYLIGFLKYFKDFFKLDLR